MTFGGAPTRWEPDGASRGVALVAPGRAYPPSAPLLEFARRALLQHDLTVRQLWWDTTTRGREDEAAPERWVRRHVAAAHAEEQADHVLVVGKSLGTRAASYAAERGLAPAAARAVADAGCFALVLEGVMEEIAVEATNMVACPTIGIGASAQCDGQILVTEDMMGLFERTPRFVKRFGDLAAEIGAAAAAYAADGRGRAFPTADQTYRTKK